MLTPVKNRFQIKSHSLVFKTLHKVSLLKEMLAGRPPPGGFTPNYGTPVASFDALDRILNLPPAARPFDSGFPHQAGPIHGAVRSDRVNFDDLQIPEDIRFAELILNTIYSLEPYNSLVICSHATSQTTFYLFAEGLKGTVNSKTLNLFHNLPYPIQGVSGVTVAEVDMSQEGRPCRLVIGFVPRHLQPQQQQPMLTASAPAHQMLPQPTPMLLETPVGMNATRDFHSHLRKRSSSSSDSQERDRSSSPQRGGFLGKVGSMGKAVLGFQSEPEKKQTKRKTRGRR